MASRDHVSFVRFLCWDSVQTCQLPRNNFQMMTRLPPKMTTDSKSTRPSGDRGRYHHFDRDGGGAKQYYTQLETLPYLPEERGELQCHGTACNG